MRSSSDRPFLLLTNDDGYFAEGLNVLRRVLCGEGKVVVVAPDREMSAVSHSLTLHRPLRIREVEQGVFSVDGTPSDCVLLAILQITDRTPDLVVSGINSGPNLGDDVTYSGTVAGAMEGTLLGVPSMAVSVAEWGAVPFEPAAEFARRLVREVLRRGIPAGILLNVNVPNRSLEAIQGVKITRLGRRISRTAVVENVDPRGRPYYWIGAQDPTWAGGEDTDFAAVAEGYVSISPLHLDLTQYEAVEELRSWELGAVDRACGRSSGTGSEGPDYDVDRDAPGQ